VTDVYFSELARKDKGYKGKDRIVGAQTGNRNENIPNRNQIWYSYTNLQCIK
jgi:hypothetical protein